MLSSFGDFFLWTRRTENGDGIEVDVTDGTRIWTASSPITQDNVPNSRKSEDWKKLCPLFLAALHNEDRERYSVDILEPETGKLQVVAKESISGSSAKALLLKFNLTESLDNPPLMKVILSNVCKSMARQRADLSKVEIVQSRLNDQILKLSYEVEQAADARDKLQDDLIRKACVVINSKKREIVRLREQLVSAKRGKRASDDEDDESSAGSAGGSDGEDGESVAGGYDSEQDDDSKVTADKKKAQKGGRAAPSRAQASSKTKAATKAAAGVSASPVPVPAVKVQVKKSQSVSESIMAVSDSNNAAEKPRISRQGSSSGHTQKTTQAMNFLYTAPEEVDSTDINQYLTQTESSSSASATQRGGKLLGPTRATASSSSSSSGLAKTGGGSRGSSTVTRQPSKESLDDSNDIDSFLCSDGGSTLKEKGISRINLTTTSSTSSSAGAGAAATSTAAKAARTKAASVLEDHSSSGIVGQKRRAADDAEAETAAHGVAAEEVKQKKASEVRAAAPPVAVVRKRSKLLEDSDED